MNNLNKDNQNVYSGYIDKLLSVSLLIILLNVAITGMVLAQSEVMAWGNLTGIRVEGQLMEFETSLRVVEQDWKNLNATGRERQRPEYDRDGVKQTVKTSIGKISFKQVVEDTGIGSITVSINTTVEKDTVVQGAFFCIELPDRYYSNASIRFTNGLSAGKSGISINSISSVNNSSPLKINCKGITIESEKRHLEINFNNTGSVYIRKESVENYGTQLYVELLGQKLRKGQLSERVLRITAGGDIDRTAAEIVLNAQKPGRKFAGLGGNFRLQNPKTDPPVIQYCLDNMRVAWSRVEMPWNLWQPEENVNPVEAANTGKLNPRVHAAMTMAQRLTSLGIPVIISDWSAPNWAILGDPRDAFRNRSKGIYGYPLNPEKTEKIFKSIGDYIQFMKDNYGVEASMFSFNESDLGINVRHTGKEHADFIKGLGAHLATRGLSTKLLLGDNSDATTFDFILPALNDPETHKYIGAVSFHSWRGCTDETLKKWAGAAKQINLPLIVGEGSTDAAAWNYPEIFSEQTFAFYEINLYIRICAICQPLSILQWQLTADYSLLTGAGIFGTEGVLHPTQRFWNLKQLASGPEDAFAIPLTCSREEINCAAFGNKSRGEYAIHIVNNGSDRRAVIKGLPPDVSDFEIYVTDNMRGMEKIGDVKVIDGTADFQLPKTSFTTLKSKK